MGNRINKNIKPSTLADLTSNENIIAFQEKIRELAELDLTTKTPEQISRIYYNYTNYIPNIWFKQKAERFNKHRFYRVRLNINNSVEDLNLINTYSYPHSSFCKTNGRANLKGKSVFYCSDDAITALTETRPKKGDIGYLGIWRPIATGEIFFAFCLSHILRTDNHWSEILQDIIPSVLEYLNKQEQTEQGRILALNDLITFKYINEKEPYPLTSWFSDQYLYGKTWHDLIIYPSVTSNSKYCNMAFHPNSVDNNLKLERIIKFKIQDIQNDKIRYSAGHIGEVENSKISWRKGSKEEIDLSKL